MIDPLDITQTQQLPLSPATCNFLSEAFAPSSPSFLEKNSQQGNQIAALPNALDRHINFESMAAETETSPEEEAGGETWWVCWENADDLESMELMALANNHTPGISSMDLDSLLGMKTKPMKTKATKATKAT